MVTRTSTTYPIRRGSLRVPPSWCLARPTLGRYLGVPEFASVSESPKARSPLKEPQRQVDVRVRPVVRSVASRTQWADDLQVRRPRRAPAGTNRRSEPTVRRSPDNLDVQPTAELHLGLALCRDDVLRPEPLAWHLASSDRFSLGHVELLSGIRKLNLGLLEFLHEPKIDGLLHIHVCVVIGAEHN